MDRPRLVVLQGGKPIHFTLDPRPCKLLINADRSPVEVHTAPLKAENLPFTQPRKQIKADQVVIHIIPEGIQQGLNLWRVQGLDFGLLDAGQGARLVGFILP